MLAGIAHRGPDGTRAVIWEDGALGFAWLRTGDQVKAMGQPVTSDHGWRLVADVRLDDRQRLASTLGRRPESGDEEVLLAAYERWGADCASHLVGDFAFALWDGGERTLLLARDPIGVRPLFWTAIDQGIAFASDLRGLLPLLPAPPPLDEIALGDYLLFGRNLHTERTVYVGIERLPPAQAMLVNDHGARRWRTWRLEDQPAEVPRDADEIPLVFSDLLRTAVTDRLREVAAVGVLMSGGLDSTTVAALADEALDACGLARPRVHSFTIGYESIPSDREREYALLLADERGFAAHYIAGEQFVPLEPCDDGFLAPAEPNAAMASCASRAVYRSMTGCGLRVGLTGFGGDPMLHPEPSYLRRFLAQGRLSCLARTTAECHRRTGSWPPLYLRGWLLRPWRRARHRASVDAAFPRGLHPEYVARAGLRDRWREVHMPAPYARRATRPFLFELLNAPFWESVMADCDPGQIGAPAEFRHPLVDVRLLAFARDLPPVPWCVDKHLLRQVTEGLLPEAIRRRPKTPFGSPPGLPGVRPERAAELMTDSLLGASGLVLPAELIPLCVPGDTHPEARRQLVRMLTVEAWLRGMVGPPRVQR